MISLIHWNFPLPPLLHSPPRMNAEVLQTRPDILSTMSEHLFGQLEGYLCITNMANTLVTKWEVMGRDIVEVRESRMGDFLCFVNTLSATHKAIRAVLASDMWFGTLLKIVDINPDTGEESSVQTQPSHEEKGPVKREESLFCQMFSGMSY